MTFSGVGQERLIDARTTDLAALLELAPLPSLLTDERGVIVDANVAAAELLALPADELAGEPLADFVADRQSFGRRLEGLAATPQEPARLRLLLDPRGRPAVDVVVAARAVRPGTLVWMFHRVETPDESDLRALARELERQRALGETIMEQIPAGLVVVAAPGGEVLEWNAVAEGILGAVPARLSDPWPLARALERGEVADGERIAVHRADGAEVLLDVRAAPVRDRSGRTIAVAAVFADVTGEAKRQRAEREFVANAAHELQTPIAAITSAAEVLASGAKDDREAREHFLGHIQRESARLTRLARALLALARAQSGVERPRHELVELRPLLDEVVAALQSSADVRVQVECPAGLALVTNRDLAAQALANLVSNAVKFTRSGPVVLRAVPAEETRVVIDVSDRGPGISEGEVERVFDRFYRAPGADTDGFGLGLAIVREAIEALDGRIGIARTGPEGTTFRVELPGAELVR